MGRAPRTCENCMYKSNCIEFGKTNCEHWRSEWDGKFEPDYAEKFKREWDKVIIKLRGSIGGKEA